MPITFFWGLGRRKSSVARVRIAPGAGGFTVNGKPMVEYFPTIQMQLDATAPLKATTSEALGFIGRGEGIAAQAACLLVPA